MSKEILAAIPIKPFGVAKRRLSTRLDAPARSRLGKAVAARTAAAATDAGALVAIVTGDADVAAAAGAPVTVGEAASERMPPTYCFVVDGIDRHRLFRELAAGEGRVALEPEIPALFEALR